MASSQSLPCDAWVETTVPPALIISDPSLPALDATPLKVPPIAIRPPEFTTTIPVPFKASVKPVVVVTVPPLTVSVPSPDDPTSMVSAAHVPPVLMVAKPDAPALAPRTASPSVVRAPLVIDSDPVPELPNPPSASHPPPPVPVTSVHVAPLIVNVPD